MQPSAEMHAWVERVLKVDLGAAGLGGADPAAAGPDAAGALPDGTAAAADGGLFDIVRDLVADVTAAVTGSDPRKDAAAQRKKALAALEAKDPEAAKQARAAFDKWDRVLGGAEVTPEAAKKAGEERAAKEKAYADALALVQKAKALPDGDKKKAAIAKAEKGFRAAKAEADKAAERDDAVVGRASLAKALSHGPLSAETGRPLDPQAAGKLIAAYGQDARMADAAVTAAATAKFPGAIADNLAPMISRAKGGFAASDGRMFVDPSMARGYGQDLLKMGGEMGPGYFARLPDYVASGQQFTPDGTGGEGEATWTGMAQKRSVALAGKLVRTDGTIDVASDGAKAAVGNLLFHPDAMRNQQPALAAHVLKTVDFLSDPVTGPQAGEVLKQVKSPTNPAAQKLVRGSLGKGPADALDDTGARTAVLAAMLKPLDQGPVGSCFATAPTRRMRETRPMDALKAYGDIASKGTYKPAFGPEVPVVTNLPAGEDPIMRNWEYTTATSTARTANSSERTSFATNVAKGTDLLKGTAVKGVADADKDKSWTTKKAKLTKDVADAFTFTYDPNSEIAKASDGSSDRGRYVVQRVSDGKEIRSQADFEAAMTEVAVASLGIDPKSAEAAEVANTVKSPAFVAAVCPDDYKPWALASGGQTTAATKTLFGDTLAQKSMTPAVGTPAPSEGDRTQQVLTSFLKNFKGDPSAMVTIRTVGMHGFNALPNDPSLAPLKGKDDAETAQRVKANLVDKGKSLRDTELDADRAGWMFDEAIRKEAGAEKDASLKGLLETEAAKHRPTAATKPAALAAAIKQALDAYHDKVAEGRANAWKTGEEAKGKTVAADALAKKRTAIKAGLDDAAQVGAKNALIQDMGAPEFVIADSNWGSSRDHSFFVVAPDPTTGEPLLWIKKVPPGTLRPAGRKWVDKEWASIQ